MIETILNIFRDLVSLFSNVYALLGYILSGAGIIAISYFLIIRPIIKSFTDKGRRMYWISHLALIIWGLVLGPYIFINLVDTFDTWGMILGLIIYATPLVLALRKNENDPEA